MKNPLRHEAVITLSTLGGVVAVVADAINTQQLDGSVLVNWRTLLIAVVVGFIRKFVNSQATVDKLVAEATARIPDDLDAEKLAKRVIKIVRKELKQPTK